MSVSLEDQRRALLEQIEASRAVYRRMLTGESAPVQAGTTLPLPTSTSAGSRTTGVASATERGSRALPGGRSKAVQWAMDHPLWVAGGVALLVLLLPRAAEARRRARDRKQTSEAIAQATPPAQGSGALRALLAASLLLLRDPARLQAAGRLARLGWQWLQRRRTH